MWFDKRSSLKESPEIECWATILAADEQNFTTSAHVSKLFIFQAIFTIASREKIFSISTSIRFVKGLSNKRIRSRLRATYPYSLGVSLWPKLCLFDGTPHTSICATSNRQSGRPQAGCSQARWVSASPRPEGLCGSHAQASGGRLRDEQC